MSGPWHFQSCDPAGRPRPPDTTSASRASAPAQPDRRRAAQLIVADGRDRARRSSRSLPGGNHKKTKTKQHHPQTSPASWWRARLRRRCGAHLAGCSPSFSRIHFTPPYLMPRHPAPTSSETGHGRRRLLRSRRLRERGARRESPPQPPKPAALSGDAERRVTAGAELHLAPVLRFATRTRIEPRSPPLPSASRPLHFPSGGPTSRGRRVRWCGRPPPCRSRVPPRERRELVPTTLVGGLSGSASLRAPSRAMARASRPVHRLPRLVAQYFSLRLLVSPPARALRKARALIYAATTCLSTTCAPSRPPVLPTGSRTSSSPSA